MFGVFFKSHSTVGNCFLFLIILVIYAQGQEESAVERVLRKAVEEEAEELRRQRGEDTKQEAENKITEECTATTFDMFATDAELPPEVFHAVHVIDSFSRKFNASF